MGNEIIKKEFTLPKTKNEINEPKSPEFIFNKSLFPNIENSKNIINIFNESLIKKYPQNSKNTSFQNLKEENEKNLQIQNLKKENLNITRTTNESSECEINNESNNTILENEDFLETEIKTSVGSLEMDIREIYKFKDLIGGGHFGTVRSAYRRYEKTPHKLYAIKSINIRKISKNNFDELIKEVDIISSLDHPNIIKFYETYNDKFYFHIVMELCRGKDLLYRIYKNKMDEKNICLIIMKILHSISYCHSKGIIHRDLKPENIIFETPDLDSDIKIIDFGLSKKIQNNEKLHSILGTHYYVAPEVLNKEYNEKCDLWSIGIITYLLIIGDLPFKGKNNNEIFKKILNDNINFNKNKWKNYSNDAKNFVKLLLQKDFNKRPSAKEALNNNWFNSIFSKINKSILIEPNIFIQLKNYKPCNFLQKLVYKYIINSMGHSELKKYKNAFYVFDYNHNGYVDLYEIILVFEFLKNEISEEHIKKLIISSEKKIFKLY